MAGTRRRQVWGWQSIGQQRVEHELAVSRVLIRLGQLDAKRYASVDKRWRHDAEFDQWAIEVDRGTESGAKLKERISIMSSSTFNILWVLPSATRMHQVGALCESLGSKVYYTNLRYSASRWVDHQGHPIDALLPVN